MDYCRCFRRRADHSFLPAAARIINQSIRRLTSTPTNPATIYIVYIVKTPGVGDASRRKRETLGAPGGGRPGQGLGRGFALPGTSASLTLALRRSGNFFLPDSSRPLRRTMRFPASFVGVFSTIGAPQTHSFDRAKRESRGAPGGSGTSVKEIWNRTIIGVFLKKVGEKEKIFWENT